MESIGIRFPRVLVPGADVDLNKWAVIACDQYTSEPEYWKKVEASVGQSPSTLRLIFPEVYLNKGKDEQIIKEINETMETYLDRRLLKETDSPGVMLVKRTLPSGKVRTGLVLAIDLDAYEYAPGNRALIRATEKTIESRIPPRLEIRQHAPIELPHVLLLIDDPAKTVIERVSGMGQVVYDFEVMHGSGRLLGSWIDDEGALDSIVASLVALKRKPGNDGMLFAVGDGNHSLATAKHHWEKIKREGGVSDHPARFALVEVVNLHEPSLEFEPIHRLVTGIDPETVLAAFRAHLTATGQELVEGGSGIGFQFGGKSGSIGAKSPKKHLPLATLSDFLDPWLAEHPGAEVDYVHGLHAIEAHPKGLGFILPAMAKDDLFRTVIKDGVLPRKTFSMGAADEKRFYFEAKLIR
jgi:Protein of unknown function (DUF1015)